ncbi:cytochrome ubiquinol oxidase subunit I [Desulfococcaceae bacterium HSG8]|nr:cytochrome ubiquinol oxidase subunit I [Desulfococcaceae bacterium HSG8]
MNSDWLLHYPVWELGFWGGGFLIALIATIHVYVAHFAVGGGLFLVLTEMKGYREKSQAILDYTKKHSKFFMLLTMVFGSVTGVGIWFTISLLNPGATSVLIHQFVFAWAAEWVFFTGEIVALFVYYYTFGKMNKKQHLTVGWIYFVFAWLSLFVINGIVAFMLTPGKWTVTGNFWDAFFNPSFFPALFFRTCMAFMLAGLFGFVSVVSCQSSVAADNGQQATSNGQPTTDNGQLTMIRYCSWWVLISFFFLLEAAYWYGISLPEPQKLMIFSRSPEIMPFLKIFLWVSPVIFIGGVIMALRVTVKVKKVLAFVLLFIGFIYMGSFEWIREAGRRPYLIYGHIYSNSVLAKDMDAIQSAGILKSARWVKNREITEANSAEAGREIFRLLCISCHSVGGPVNDILPLTRKFSVFGMDAMLDGMGKISDYMPRFAGSPEERGILADYIVNMLHKRGKNPELVPRAPQLPADIPDFDPGTSPYVLLAWSGQGMYFVSDCDPWFSLSPTGNDMYAQLIRRGETPERVSDGVKMTFIIESGLKNTPFRNIGMDFDEDSETYAAKNVAIMPYKNDGGFHPYPIVTIEARDSETGELLAMTRITAPVSTEMGCKNCHGGEWRVGNVTGISPGTSRDILAVHDRISKTDLLEMAEKGQPWPCYECHLSEDSGTGGNPHPALNLSAAIHGFHANYLTNRDGDACAVCHPSSPQGFTRGFRGIHQELGLDCTNCHGKMEDHALSLLAAEKAAGKKEADRLMKHLVPRAAETVQEIAPRKPWINEPDCMNCHTDFNPPETDTSEFSRWTAAKEELYSRRTDEVGIICAGCHGAPHAIYPATNIFGNDRDNIPPVQYQKEPYPIGANKNCKVCHTIDMEDEIHHPNSLNMFRNTR